jgi:hypothetical protein
MRRSGGRAMANRWNFQGISRLGRAPADGEPCWGRAPATGPACPCLKLSGEAKIMWADPTREAPLSEAEPIQFSPRRSSAGVNGSTTFTHSAFPSIISFTRAELNAILDLYGRKVAAGDWRDYAIDFGREKAVFSVFRHASEVPLYRIEKNPRLARRQGAYSVIAATGLILKRGADLTRVLAVLEKNLRLAAV